MGVAARLFATLCGVKQLRVVMRRSGTSVICQSLLGFGRDSRLPVSGYLIILTLIPDEASCVELVLDDARTALHVSNIVEAFVP